MDERAGRLKLVPDNFFDKMPKNVIAYKKMLLNFLSPYSEWKLPAFNLHYHYMIKHTIHETMKKMITKDKNVLVSKQILPSCTIRNKWRSLRKMYRFILGLKVEREGCLREGLAYEIKKDGGRFREMVAHGPHESWVLELTRVSP